MHVACAQSMPLVRVPRVCHDKLFEHTNGCLTHCDPRGRPHKGLSGLDLVQLLHECHTPMGNPGLTIVVHDLHLHMALPATMLVAGSCMQFNMAV